MTCSATLAPQAYPQVDEVTFKTPIKYWLSFLILPILITLAEIDVISDKEKIQSFKNNPQVNTWFVVKEALKGTEETPFSYARVEDVKDGTVSIRFGTYFYGNASMARKTICRAKGAADDFFPDEVITMGKEVFQNLDIKEVVH